MLTGDGETDKKGSSNRRSRRRSKQTNSVAGASSGNEVPDSAPESGEVAKQSDTVDATGYTLLKRPVDAPAYSAISSRPNILGFENNGCSEPLTGATPSSSSYPTMSDVQVSGRPSCSNIEFFSAHLSIEDAIDAVEKGNAFKALFRANPHNRQEAYCTIDGVPTDILVSGHAAQNRAVHGDMVVIQIDPLACWTKMKGPTMPCNDFMLAEDCESINELNDSNSFSLTHEKNIEDIDDEKDHTECSCCHEDFHYENCRNSERGKEEGCSSESRYSSSAKDNIIVDSIKGLGTLIGKCHDKRPTGRIVSIFKKSSHRDTIVGFLNVKHWLYCKKFGNGSVLRYGASSNADDEYIQLTPTDPRYPKMLVRMRDLPDTIRARLEAYDETVELDLVAAVMDDWSTLSLFPRALVLHSFGQGSDMDAQINAILYKNSICQSEFPPEALSSFPQSSWEVPLEEIKSRRDLRKLCIFTIDPSTATDLDDSFSFEKLPNGRIRIGVHIADVSFFVLPDTILDREAQARSTSVYLVRKKISMFPAVSENLMSLNPGVNRLAFSIIWDMNSNGEVLERWIGRTVIHSCCKLSYDFVQNIINKEIDDHYDHDQLPKLYGHFQWSDVFNCLHGLYRISKILRKRRMGNGALCLETSRVTFGLDEIGIVNERKESNFLVEEFMLLANSTAAEVISRTFPDCALLRRHPEPHLRKLRDIKTFCSKLGFKLDASSSGQLNKSLEEIREKLKDERLLFDIVLYMASRSMQSAEYFCSGDMRDNPKDWAHYALAVPLYTHFTSPLRRYPDIVVHRTLAAAIDAEGMYISQNTAPNRSRKGKKNSRCFTGLHFDRDAAESSDGRNSLLAAASKHCVPGVELLSKIASHCNERKLACRDVRDASSDVYMWMALRRQELLLTEATVMGLGPRFMSIYIHKLAIERRIYYNEVDGLIVEWLENTSTLILSFSKHGHRLLARTASDHHRAITELALVINSCDLDAEEPTSEGTNGSEEQRRFPVVKPDVTPAVLPLILRNFSTVPVAVNSVGDGCPIEVKARLFLSSYFG